MYIIDTSILVNANRIQFPMAKNNTFWDWLVDLGKKKIIQIPQSVFEEIGEGNDDLPNWLEKNKNHFLLLKHQAYAYLDQVMDAYAKVYAKDDLPPEGLLESLKADPYIIAHAKNTSASVVTCELAKKGDFSNYKEVRIPHVCQKMGIPCLTFTQFIWELRDHLPE